MLQNKWNVATVFFFFFKQKTAYEMRISDWSSDVCSSDLDRDRVGTGRQRLLGALVVDPLPDALFHPHPGTAGATAERGRLAARHFAVLEIGRASCRERVCQYV